MRWMMGLGVCALVGCFSNTVDLESSEGSGGDPSTTSGSGAADGGDDVVTTIPPTASAEGTGPPPPPPQTTSTTSPPPPPDTGPQPEWVLPPGRYLLVVDLAIAPGLPLQWQLWVEDGFSYEAQSLSLDPGSTTTPRELVGEPWIGPLYMDPACSVCSHTETMAIEPAANPITGSEITLQLSFGGFDNGGYHCGEAYGDIVAPIQADLAGSTFALIPLADGEPFPVDFPFGC